MIGLRCSRSVVHQYTTIVIAPEVATHKDGHRPSLQLICRLVPPNSALDVHTIR